MHFTYSNNPALGNTFHIEDLERKGDKIKFLKLISRKSFPAAVVCQKAIGKHFYAQIIVLVAIFAYLFILVVAISNHAIVCILLTMRGTASFEIIQECICGLYSLLPSP